MEIVLALLRPLLRLLHERLGAGSCDRAEVVDQFRAGHADAGIGDGDGLGLLVRLDADFERAVPGQKLRSCYGLVAEFVERVGRVGNELAQEHIALGINRVHHEIEKLRHLRLKSVRLRLLRLLRILSRVRRRLRHGLKAFPPVLAWSEGNIAGSACRQAAAGTKKTAVRLLTADLDSTYLLTEME